MISFLLRRSCFEFPAILGMNFSENSTKASRKPQAVLMELCKSGAGKDRVFFFCDLVLFWGVLFCFFNNRFQPGKVFTFRSPENKLHRVFRRW